MSTSSPSPSPSRSPWPAARVVLRRRARRAGQGGFALMAGLMVWFALCSVTLIALLGLTLSASKSALELSADARRDRAVDAALESAITQIRMDPAGTVGAASTAGSGACERALGTSGGELRYSDDEGTDVAVTAQCERATRLIPAPAPGEPATSRLDVVGESYSSPTGLADTLQWSTDCSGGTGANCYPWRAAIGGPNLAANQAGIAAMRPTVVHTSDPSVATRDATLEVAADTVVARSGMPLVNPPRVDGAAGISVAGSYQQRDAGPFSSVGGTNSCGMVGPGFPWLVPGGRISDSDDESGAPTCSATVTPLTDGLAAPTTWAQVSPLRTTPACPSGAGSVATFSPGAYTRTQTAALNDLLGGSCPGRVFWFQPGDYWFDVDDTSNAAAERNSLVVDDPTVRVIFGQPTGGATAAAAAAATFPEACDRGVAGVSITLSPRTSLRHTQGLVAVCDRATSSSGTPPPAVWQTPAADGGWRGTPDAARSGIVLTRDNSWFSWGSAAIANQANAWIMDGANATATFSCSVILFGGCGADVNMSAVNVGGSTPAPAAAVASSRVRSLDVLLKASARNNSSFTASLVGGNQASTQITLYKAGATTPTCAIGMPSVPDPRAAAGFQNTYDFDLFSPQAEAITGIPRCVDVRDGAGLTRADLRGARVDVRLRLYTWVTFLGFFDTVIDIDGMELRAGWDLVPTGGTGGTGWNNATNITALDGQHTGYTLTCPSSGSCPTATRSMTATGLDNLTNPWVPTDGPLQAAGVVVTGETTSQNWFTNGSFYDLNGAPDTSANSWMRVTVNAADGSQLCQVQWSRIPFWGQGTYLDLLGSPGNCGSRLTSARQLIGASATLEVYLQRNSNAPNAVFGTRIDHLKISTVTGGSYTGPTAPHLFTQAAGAARSSFTAFGPWSTPRATLNVLWSGAPPTRTDGSDVPVLGGQTVVSSVGSRVLDGGAAGVLCCSGTKPAERVVTLRAQILTSDGARQDAAVVRVRVSDVGRNGSSVRVEDWSLL